MSNEAILEWIKIPMEKRREMLKDVPLNTLLVNPRHELWFTENFEALIQTTLDKGGKEIKELLKGSKDPSKRRITLNIILNPSSTGEVVSLSNIRGININNGNRRVVSIGVAMQADPELPGWTVGDLGKHAHILVNGYEVGEDLETTKHWNCWIPGQTVVSDLSLLADQLPHGDDNSRSLKGNVCFDSEGIAFVHRGRPVEHVSRELRRLLA
eukprot:TRINITY_DN13123_c0_g1_i1.p1 TRINITY_DN13123_c0_g1~~TRINITY_DN13123_c0_g1_i1.p1  ORF type:complete len:212 (+),score=12.01 TRINITY_DN13123_c0_g1_i1:74-709(+)